MLALAAIRFCSASTMSGRRSNSEAAGRQALSGKSSSSMSASARDRAGVATEQHADEILLPRDLTFELGTWARRPVLRFGLPVVAFGHGTLLEAHALQSRRFAQLCEVAAHFELGRAPQLDVAGGDVRDDRQHDRALALLAGEEARARDSEARRNLPRSPVRSSPRDLTP